MLLLNWVVRAVVHGSRIKLQPPQAPVLATPQRRRRQKQGGGGGGGGIGGCQELFYVRAEDEPGILDRGDGTLPCAQCVALLQVTHDAARRALHGTNLMSFLSVLGMAFGELLLTHLKQFRFSETVGLILMRYMDQYRTVVREFKSPKVDSAFELLRTLCTILVVPAVSVKGFLDEPTLAGVPKEELFAFVKLREDFQSRDGQRAQWAKDLVKGVM